MNGCPKKAYLVKADARHAKRDAAAKYRDSRPGRLVAYRCERCDLWHIGHLAVEVIRGEKSRGIYRNAA